MSLIVVVALVVLVASVVARTGTRTSPLRSSHRAIDPGRSAESRRDRVHDARWGRQIDPARRSWRETGREPPTNGTYLLVEVKIVCTSGHLGYDPYNFQAFDHTGELFDVAEAGVSRQVLGVGELSEGQTTRGFLAFDIPRGDVTLLMSDDSDQSITALKIPD